MAGESCDDSCAGLSHTGRKVRSSFAILKLIGHSYCVTVIKHLMSLRRIKVTNEPKDASTACKVRMIKNSVEFLKWNEEKVLP